jgi:hypothetical protein
LLRGKRLEAEVRLGLYTSHEVLNVLGAGQYGSAWRDNSRD